MASYTTEEAAKILKAKPDTIRKWVKRGKLKSYKFGTRVMVSLPDDLDIPPDLSPVPPELSVSVPWQELPQDTHSALVDALQARIAAQEEMIRLLLSKVPEPPKQLPEAKKRRWWERWVYNARKEGL